MRIVIVIFLLLIIYNLGAALFYIVRGKTSPDQVSKKLGARVALSATLVALIVLSKYLGWL
jgi:hypothetical protein